MTDIAATEPVVPGKTDLDATAHWQRYEHGRTRGHREYCQQAKKNENFFLGAQDGKGGQWDDVDRALLAAQGRPAYEFNELMPSVNSAVGYQIHNRMDIAFKPRGGKADQDQADIRSKIAMQIADRNKLHWLETQVFTDGIIQQRGYFDIRLDFAENLQGNIAITTLDPLDVVPDPDAKQYDPDTWSDVCISRWLTFDEVEEQFGHDMRVKVENMNNDDADHGDDDGGEERNKFGNSQSGAAYDAFYVDGQVSRVRVIDRQRWVYSLTKVGVWPDTGDVKIIEDQTPEALAKLANEGVIITKRMQKRVKWTVSTRDHMLHDGWSPYRHFTVVPYFAYFRRGKTRGMIDNGIGPQEALNKAMSQYIHVVNGTANGGWTVEEDSLTNMRTDELEDHGAKTGLVVEYKKGSTPPAKIQPNTMPAGVDKLIDRASKALKDVTVPEAMRGVNGPEVAGIAIQSKQFASQQQLATPLDNLSYTRNLLAIRMLALMQTFYTDARVFAITETNPSTGKEETTEIAINQFDPMTGTYTNDMTEGDYDVVVTDQPMAATFGESQFKQALELKNAGIDIPDSTVIRHSNLTDKAEILASMADSAKADPMKEAKIALLNAQAAKTTADVDDVKNASIKKMMEAMFSGMQGAEVIATNPAVAPIADELLMASGYRRPNPMGDDPNFPTPDVLSGAVPAIADMPTSTTREVIPLTKPTTPGVGKQRGIETLRADSGPQAPTVNENVMDGAPGFADGGMIDEDDPRVYGNFMDRGPTGSDTGFEPSTFTPSRFQAATPQNRGARAAQFAQDEKNEAAAQAAYDAPAQFGNTMAEFGGIDKDEGIRSRFANGGMIRGPGTGTSDSIPAINTDNGQPIKVSNGEFIIPESVVQIMGKEFFESLIQRFHTPVQDSK